MLTNSPAIDKGPAAGLATDQRDFARPFEQTDMANADNGGYNGGDIGAFELTPTYRISGRIADAQGMAMSGMAMSGMAP